MQEVWLLGLSGCVWWAQEMSVAQLFIVLYYGVHQLRMYGTIMSVCCNQCVTFPSATVHVSEHASEHSRMGLSYVKQTIQQQQ